MLQIITAASAWINKSFYGFDAAIFEWTHNLEQSCPWLYNVARFISYLGDEGIFIIALSLLLLVFRKTRKLGIIACISVAFGSILNNFVLKEIIARPRPYDEVELFRSYWLASGEHLWGKESILMHSWSFPSGHTTLFSTFGVAMFIGCNKKYSWAFLFMPFIMAWSRVALFVHYPSDVLFGILIGVISGVVAYYGRILLLKIKFVENLTTGDKLF